MHIGVTEAGFKAQQMNAFLNIKEHSVPKLKNWLEARRNESREIS